MIDRLQRAIYFFLDCRLAMTAARGDGLSPAMQTYGRKDAAQFILAEQEIAKNRGLPMFQNHI
jgi:hypothetical protein